MRQGAGTMSSHPAAEPRPARGADSAPLSGTVHLALAVTSLLTVFIDARAGGKFSSLAWLTFFGFTAHSLTLYIMALRGHPGADSRIVLWLNIAWYAMLVYTTGSNNSLFFLFFFFTILIASFRYGFDEGARITLASTFLFSLTAVSTVDPAQLVQVLLRAAFMLALGYMMATWGAANLAQKAELALLRDVSRLSNPRFGIEQTARMVMEHSRLFYGADSCILLSHRPGSPRWYMRTVSAAGEKPADFIVARGADATPPLMQLPAGQAVVYSRPLLRRWSRSGEFCAWDARHDQWTECKGEAGEQMADLLEARSFISAPLAFQNGVGRVFLASATRSFNKHDALFLCHILGQVVPVLENIHLLDRMASEAAVRERQAISRDLHDSTVQPYIGLSHTLSALRNKAAPDNPLRQDIEHLASMAAEVVRDLRRFAGGFAREQALGEALVAGALRQHLDQVRQFYGLDIALHMDDGAAAVGDRLAASLFQLVCEGVSNIRKHTEAREGAVRIRSAEGRLHIEIDNPESGHAWRAFSPVSLTQRTEALGGTLHVVQGPGEHTIVEIDIPL
jgi:signal transduction histidine kinase